VANVSQAYILYTGTEYTNDGSGYTSESGASHPTEWFDTFNTEHDGWSNGDVLNLNGTSNATGFWYHQYTWWADRTLDQPWSC
jgi:hypothetical protein